MVLRRVQPQYSRSWNTFRQAFHSLNRQAELQQLIRWAIRKRLPNPLNLYRHRFSDEQVRYARYCLVSPHAATLAYYAHALTGLFRQPPRYPKRGSAAFYRAKHLDKVKNRHIV